jgi:hypothetical protein
LEMIDSSEYNVVNASLFPEASSLFNWSKTDV